MEFENIIYSTICFAILTIIYISIEILLSNGYLRFIDRRIRSGIRWVHRIAAIIFCVYVFAQKPPRDRNDLLYINGHSYVPFDVYYKNVNITRTDHDKRSSEEINQLRTRMKELDDMMQQKEADFVTLTVEMEEQYQQLLLKYSDLKKENSDLFIMYIEDKENCENNQSDRCVRYRELIEKQVENDYAKKQEDRRKMHINVICLIVFATLYLLANELLYELGIYRKVFNVFTKKETLEFKDQVTVSIDSFRYKIFVLILALLMIIINLMALIIWCCWQNLMIFAFYIAANAVMMIWVWNMNAFAYHFANSRAGSRYHKEKGEKGVLPTANDMQIMPAPIYRNYLHNYDQEIAIIINNNVNIQQAIDMINNVGLTDITMIARQYLVNNAVGLGGAQNAWINAANQAPIDTTGPLRNYINIMRNQNGGVINDIQSAYNYLCYLSDLMVNRVRVHMQDFHYVQIYVKMLFLIAYIINLGPIPNNIIHQTQKDKITEKMVKNIRNIDETFKYDMNRKKFIKCYKFQYSKDVFVFSQPVSEDKATIQMFNRTDADLNVKPCKIEGTIKVKCQNPESLVPRLSAITPEIKFDVQYATTTPHADSHYYSKVHHIRNINDMIDLNHDDVVLDVGTNFCDVKLGHGIWYNLSNEEEADALRIVKYLQRVDRYVTTKKSNIIILSGDVTTMDLVNTKVKNVYLQNCVYNIDLAKMIQMLQYNHIERCTTMTQLSHSVLEFIECQNRTNEMTYSYIEGNCESTLSKANFKIKGVTEGSQYVHNGAILIDWFKYNSIQTALNVFWNKEIDGLRDGYYRQTWYKEDRIKEVNETLQDNEDSMDCIAFIPTRTQIQIKYCSRSTEVNTHDLAFIAKDIRSPAEQTALMKLRNSNLDTAEVIHLPFHNFRELTYHDFRKATIFYRVARPAIKQHQTRMDMIMRNLKPQLFEQINVDTDKLNVDDLWRKVRINQRAQFVDLINQCTLRGEQIYVIYTNETVYKVEQAINSVRRNVTLSLDVCLRIINQEIDIKDRKNITIDQLFIMCRLVNHRVTRKHEKIDLSNVDSMHKTIDDIEKGKMCDVVNLDRYDKINDKRMRNLEIESQKYKIPIVFAFASARSTDNALETGQIDHKHITSLTIINMDEKKIYDKYHMLQVNGNAVNRTVYDVNDLNGHHNNHRRLPQFMQSREALSRRENINDNNSRLIQIEEQILFNDIMLVRVGQKDFYANISMFGMLGIDNTYIFHNEITEVI